MKKEGVHSDKDVEQYQARLEEILKTPLGTLAEDEVLSLLSERKQLEAHMAQYAKQQQEQAEQARIGQERKEIQSRIAKLNQSISPDKGDEELLQLIAERKELEAKLAQLETGAAEVNVLPEQEVVPVQSVAPVAKEEPAVAEIVETVPETTPESVVSEPAAEQPKAAVTTETIPAHDEIGKESIVVDRAEESGELKQYLEQLRGSESSLGIFLQSVPESVRRSKRFMLKVAEVDPAYAMHYADPVLRQDEDFNMKVVAFPNRRNSGSVLAEMSPEMRTEKVVMIAVKQDYRNIRFAVASMAGYREMIDIAKKGTLEKVKALKDGADASFLVPKVLQKDPDFMREIESVVASVGPAETREESQTAEAEAAPDTADASHTPKSAWSIHHSEL